MPDGRVYNDILMKPSHESNCGSSCYDCLRDYYNQQHHTLLNWRVALDIAALAFKANHPLDFNERYWKGYLNSTLLSILERKLDAKREIRCGYHFLRNVERAFLLAHPFWNNTKIKEIKEKRE